MKWLDAPVELRACASVLVGCLAAWILLMLGVSNSLQALVCGLVAGLFAALAAGRLPSGWSLFSAGCALCVTSRLQPQWFGPGWLTGVTWMMALLVGWMLSGLLVDRLYLWLDPGSFEGAGREGSRGLLGLGWTALITALWLLWLFPSAPALAVPITFILAMRSSARFRLSHPAWVALGALVGLLLAYLLPTQTFAARPDLHVYHSFPAGNTPIYPYDLGALPPPDPWLLGGLLLMSSVAGFWAARWRLGESREP